MANESELERTCKDLASLLGWIAYKGGGRVGAPDKIFIKGSRVFTVEFKRRGKKQTPAQREEQAILQAHKISYTVVDNMDSFRVLLIEKEKEYFSANP